MFPVWHFLVSNALGARGHDFEIVVSGQPWDAVVPVTPILSSASA